MQGLHFAYRRWRCGGRGGSRLALPLGGFSFCVDDLLVELFLGEVIADTDDTY